MTVRAISVLACFVLFLGASASAQDQPTIVQVITAKVRPGTNAQFEEFVRAYRDASRKREMTNYWHAAQSVSGEPTYTINLAHARWADLATPGPELAEVYGEREAARLLALARDSIEHLSVAFYLSQPAMSNAPPADTRFEAVIYYHIALNPGMLQQYGEMSRQTTEASIARYPDSYYLTQTPTIGAAAVRVVGFVPTWGDLDTPLPTPGQRNLEHFGPDEGARINALAGEAIRETQVVLHRVRADLSYQPEP